VAAIMDKNVLDRAIEKVVDLNIRAIEIYERDFIQPIIDEIKNPEKVIGKKYETWTPQDLQLLSTVYQTMPHILNDFIAKREYDNLIALQTEV
jgi:hypothetical protein